MNNVLISFAIVLGIFALMGIFGPFVVRFLGWWWDKWL